ncbi:acyl-CoA dehydrogenase family protein [Streptomyces sp. enrichment culture]|uniref:acyl-CoA dehydrogenase family protein n=1 Tax=Streptomyces sp. enrichment culture TaxID=1795815 RepID=UPI003F561836
MAQNVRRWMTDDVLAVRELARSFFTDEAVPRRAEWERLGGVEKDFWRKAGSLGLLGASVPERYGGGGGTLAHDLVIFQEQVGVGEHGFGNSMHSGVVAQYIEQYGTPEQKLRWLPGMCSGDLVGALALTEPDAGSDLRGIRTTAVRGDDGYRVDGSKMFITNGSSADLIVTAVRTDPGAGTRGMSLLVVEADRTPGLRRGRRLAKLGQHTSDTAPLYFQDALVPAGNLLGREGAGFLMLMRQLPRERLIIAAEAVAAARRAVDVTLDRAREAGLFAQQHVRFEIARCATQARVAESFLDDCVEQALNGELDTATASMAKIWCTETTGHIIDRCLDALGETAAHDPEFPLVRMRDDLRVQRIYGGTNEVMLEMVASSL